ncbi:LysM peptidoglycan-binding domain-containing protein [Cryobacterium sp. PH31-L1]|uniref:lytic transglycosylase n=1 Tax=Cryobacterium sp. PH31-L1 TaxID=3046199 RepID=UPI0024BB5A04|nr:LysM peptidoglycan-binding domain-containing protein [Cryobacterium sp. PH31-L1]MDJ0378094.1 LysM peptidoglycan-binding domain-containing protein [Cryobacterium sp. PH31-L1]
MSTKVKTNTTDATASAARSATVPETAGVAFSGNDAAAKRRAKKPGDSHSRPALLTMPIVLVSTLAISLNLAVPAQAQALAKKPLKSKLAETTPVLAVNAVAAAVQVAPAQYSVVDGDTVSGIAARFGLSTVAVLAQNGLDSRALIFPGQVLTLTEAPTAVAASPTASAASYSVQSGDTISGIAAAHGLKTADVLGANGLTRASVIFPGQVIVLAAAPVLEPAVYVAPVAEIAAVMTHTIASGETITAVANAAGVSVQAVLDANGLGWSSIIYPGQVLTLPGTLAPASVAVTVPVATAGVVTPMSEEMRQNAQTIVSVGRGAGVSNAGLVVALAAAAQESGLRNVDYGDRDSLGLFQQRPSAGWGTPEQVMDPVRASLAFFGGASNPNPNVTRGLLDIAGWESLTVTQAAQAVQISAYPDYYAKWETSAQAWLSQLG